MKFKEIKPSMVIHCPKEEDARALLEHLAEMGYEVSDEIKTNAYRIYKEKVCFYINPTENVSYGDINFYTHDKNFRESEGNLIITEFSDLIEPDDSPINSDTDSPMSAAEVLKWLKKYRGKMELKECFGQMYAMDILFNLFTAEEILGKITAYEAAKKAPKPVEVEWADRVKIIQIDHDMKLCVYEEDLKSSTPFIDDPDLKEQAETILKKYASEHEGEFFAVIENVCRVKEGK